MVRHPPESLREPLRVAIVAASTDLRAARNWVPRCIGPFDRRARRHPIPLGRPERSNLNQQTTIRAEVRAYIAHLAAHISKSHSLK